VRFYSGGDAAAAAKAAVTSTHVALIAMLVVVVAAVCVPQIGAHVTLICRRSRRRRVFAGVDCHAATAARRAPGRVDVADFKEGTS
jgi:hypothetical protein